MFVLFSLIFSFCVNAEEADVKGTCGESVNWSIGNSVLRIYGEGDMYDFTYNSSPSCAEYHDSISSVVIEPGVTSVGDYAFYSSSGYYQNVARKLHPM